MEEAWIRQAKTLQARVDGDTMGATRNSLKDLTEGERSALLQYKSSESYKVNAKLRDGIALTKAEQAMVDELDRALEKLPRVEGTVYRTLNFDDVFAPLEEYEAFISKHRAGLPVAYKAYTSASTKADGYPLADGAKYGVTLEIASRNARDLAGFGNNFESEALFPRRSVFDITRVTTDKNGHIRIYIEEVQINGRDQHQGHDTQKRGGTVRDLQETHSAHTDLQGVSGADTRGDHLRGENLQGAGAQVKFSLKSPVEETKNLIALHNLTEEKLWGALRLGGFPMPSIAVVKATEGHNKYGPISLVFSKSTIDPQADSRNKVYGSDAWTPTHSDARVDYEVDYDTKREFEQNIETLAKDVAGGIFSQSSVLDMVGVSDQTDMSLEETAHRLATRYDSVRAAYLADKGGDVEIAYRTKEFDSFGNDALKSYLDQVGEQEAARLAAKMLTGERLNTAEVEMVKDAIMESWTAKNEWRLKQKPELREKRIAKQREKLSDLRAEDFARNAWDFYEDGGTTTNEVNRMETAENLRHAVDDRAVEAWVLDMLWGLTGDPAIYNGADPFDARGNRRSFGETHWSYTLENIVRAMNNAKARGQGLWGMSGSGLVATATPEYNSVREMHADEGRLRTVDGAEYEQMVKSLDGELDRVAADIMRTTAHHTNNSFEEEEIIGEVIAMAAQGKRTVAGVKQTFRKEGYIISDAQARAVLGVIEHAGSIPTSYFEAKPQRAVGFDEVLAAVIPDDSSQKLRDGLTQAGVRMLEYQSGNEADRLAKVNGVEGARFSLKEDSEGSELTKAQQEYFQDSKVLDGQGRLKVMYRGGSGDFTVFDRKKSSYSNLYGRGFYFTDSEAHARQYGSARSFYLNITNPVPTAETTITRAQMRKFIKAVAENEDDFSFENYGYGATVDSVLKSVYGKSDFAMLYDVSQTAIGDMVAAVELFNEVNGTGFDGLILDTETVAFRSNQIKNTDNLAPTGDPDIRYSLKEDTVSKNYAAILEENELLREQMKDYIDLQRRNGKLQESRDYWQGQTRRTKRITTDKKAVSRAARELIRSYGADLDAGDITQDLQSLYDYLASGYDGKDELTYTEARRRAEAIAEKLVGNAVAVDETYEQYSDLRAYLRSTTLSLSEEDSRDIPDYGDWRKHQMGRMVIREGHTNIDQVYQEMSELWPEFFDEQRENNPVDQLLRIAEVMDGIYNVEEYNPFGPYMQQAITGAANEIMERFFDLPQTRATFADRQARKLDDAKAKGRERVQKAQEQNAARLAELRQQNRERTAKAVERERTRRAEQIGKLKQRYREKDAAGRERRSARELRAKNNYGGNGLGKVSGFGNQLLNVDMLNPLTFLHLFGRGGDALYHELQEARDRKTEIMERTAELVQDVIGKADISAMQEKTHTFQVSGGEITLSTAQLMSLYELTKREQAQDHIYKGGLRPTEQKRASNLLGKLENPPDGVKVDPGDVSRMLSALTEQETKIADGLQAIMQGYLADEGNQESMKVFGYRKFTEEHYFPITSDPNHVQSKIGDILEGGVKRPVSVAEWGSAKGTTKGANNGLLLGDIFDVFAQHAVDMSTYASHLGALEDVNRVRNFTFRNEEGDRTGQMKSIIQRVAGQHGNAYLDKLLQDISRGTAKGGVTGLSRLTANYKAASVGLNLRVALQQPTSYARTLAVMDGKYLADPRVMKMGGWEKALKYAPIARWKDWGNFEVNQGRQFQDILFGTDSKLERARNASMKLASAMDSLTWGRIWNACELETADLRRDLTRGSEAFYRAVAQRFTDVVDQTQVVDNVLGRSQFMRSGDNLAKMASSYMGEPTQSYNLFYRAYRDAVQEQNPTKRRQAAKRMGRAAGALVFSMFLNAVAQSLWDAVRDDDDRDEKYWERVLGHILPNFAQNVNPMGMVPYLRDVLSILQGYDVERMDLAAVTGLVQAARGMQKALNGEGRYTVIGAGANLVAELSRVVGLPVPTVKRDVLAIARSMGIETGDWYFQYQIERAINSLGYSGNRKEFYDIAFGALSAGELDVYQQITADMMAGGVKASSIEAAMRDRLEAAQTEDPAFTLTQRAKDLIGTSERYGHEEKTQAGFGAGGLDPAAYARYNAQRAETYRTWANELEQSAGFRRMNDAGKDKALDAAEKLAKHLALIEHSGGQVVESDLSQWERWATNGEAWGVDPTEAILFKAAYDMSESDKDKAGKTISGSKKENTLEAAAELLPGLTDEELEYLMSNFWKPEDRELSEMRERGFMP